MLRKFLNHYLWLALLAAGLALPLDRQLIPGEGAWNILELRSIDARFLLKAPPAPNAARDVVLIVIDEKSYQKINQPLIFYHTYITEVIDYLVKCGVRVIGLDLELPSISLENRVAGGYESIYTRSFLNAKRKGVDVVIGFSGGSPPLPIYLVAAGRNNLAALTLTLDRDEFVRRQQLTFGEENRQYDSFPYLLAQKFARRPLSPPGPRVMIDYSLGAEVALYSFHEVLEGISGQIQPERFKDKVVIIGARLKYEDSHLTPPHRFWAQTRGRTPGIFIQAATLTTLLTGRFFREPGTLAGGVYIFLASLLAVVCCFQRKPLPGALLCLLLTGVLALLGIFCFNRFYVLRLLPLAAAVWLAYGAATIFDYYTKERKISQIRNRFASFVPEKIIDQLVDRNVQELTEGEQRELAIFFSDIRDFTPYSERHKDEPKRIVTFLNRYHTEMTEIILANNGTVSLLIGDGIFAFFGAPVASSDPVMDAVRTAVQMRERIAALKDFWRECGQEELRIGVGIHVGEAIVGNIGSVKKMAYVAIGDNINLTARIEGLTKEFQEMILLSAGAYERVRDRVAARRLGEAKVKGHSDVTLYALDNILI